jgi:hypothetical protein
MPFEWPAHSRRASMAIDRIRTQSSCAGLRAALQLAFHRAGMVRWRSISKQRCPHFRRTLLIGLPDGRADLRNLHSDLSPKQSPSSNRLFDAIWPTPLLAACPSTRVCLANPWRDRSCDDVRGLLGELGMPFGGSGESKAIQLGSISIRPHGNIIRPPDLLNTKTFFSESSDRLRVGAINSPHPSRKADI